MHSPETHNYTKNAEYHFACIILVAKFSFLIIFLLFLISNSHSTFRKPNRILQTTRLVETYIFKDEAYDFAINLLEIPNYSVKCAIIRLKGRPCLKSLPKTNLRNLFESIFVYYKFCSVLLIFVISKKALLLESLNCSAVECRYYSNLLCYSSY